MAPGVACTSDAPCMKKPGVCNAAGLCESSGPDVGASCSAGPCMKGGICNAKGNCEGTPDVGAPCSAGPCMKKGGICNAKGSCEGTPDVGAPCYAGECLPNAKCDTNGACVGTVNVGTACSAECQYAATCQADGTCSGTQKSFGTSCAYNTWNECTDYAKCEYGVCQTPPWCQPNQYTQSTQCNSLGAPCKPDLGCGLSGICLTSGYGLKCMSWTWQKCPEDPATCQLVLCSSGTGTCTLNGSLCNDGNPCTADSCNGKGGCVYTPVDGLTCGNGRVCKAGQCILL